MNRNLSIIGAGKGSAQRAEPRQSLNFAGVILVGNAQCGGSACGRARGTGNLENGGSADKALGARALLFVSFTIAECHTDQADHHGHRRYQ